MKAVIFNGAKNGDLTLEAIEKNIVGQLTKTGWEVEPIELRSMQIAPCLGCFGCWVKTPGVCMINDAGRETTRKAIQSDLLVWLTPVTFGGYSSELKKALDRIIPILLPYFKVYHGQVHHQMRYEKYPNLLVIGVQDPGLDYKETFSALAERNMLNFRPPLHAVGVFQQDKDLKAIPDFVGEQLQKVEAKS
jgi:multimeric flavodoxin WrbA